MKIKTNHDAYYEKIGIRKILLAMKLSLFLIFLSVFQVSAISIYSQNLKISLDMQNVTVRDVIKEVEKQGKMSFFFNDDLQELNTKISVSIKDQPVSEVLGSALSQANMTFQEIKDNFVVLLPIPEVLRVQPAQISGQVTDGTTDAPLPGVTIVIEGTNIGTITDLNGRFTITVPSSDAVILVSFVGYVSERIPTIGLKEIIVKLMQDLKSLEEVVVVGYGTQKKINLTGAVDFVQGDVLQNRPAANVGALLQGVSPNLNVGVTQYGGEPGAGTTFNIRGIGTLSGEGAPLILVDGVEMNINNLDPEAIASVTILKDAASAAIYGSRAPFGVVLITTKRGSKDKGISISYSNNTAFSSPINLPAWQSSLRYVTAYNQSLENSGLPHKFPAEQIDRIERYIAGTYTPEYDTINPPNSIWAGRHTGNANYEWWDEYFKDVTVNQKHNINISGGDEKTQYYISTGLFDQGSSYNWTDEYYRRYNVLANISSQATKWLRLNINTKYANTKSAHPNSGSDWDPGRTFVIAEMTKFFPTTPFYNVNGTVNNPYVNLLMQAGPATFTENDLFIALGGEIEPIKGWKTNFNYNFNINGSKSTWLDSEIWVEIPDGQVINFWNDPNYYTENWGSNNYNSIYAYTSYEKTIQNHFFKGMVGYERESRMYSGIYGQRFALISEEVPSFTTSTGEFNLSDNKGHWGTEAFFGRLNYNYMEKYLLEINGRYNGSSRFAKDSRWGFFPSVSVGYNIAKESFWEPIEDYVTNLKIRASYGSLGNQNVLNYLYLSNIPIGTNLEWIIDDQRPNFAGLPLILSPSLTWETVNTFNLAVDAYFLNNRFGIVFDWFERNTLNMFGPSMILPSSLGTDPPQENNASLSTKGWELSLEWNDRMNNGLIYSARFILADSRTTVTEYLNETGLIDQFYVGKEIGEVWGYTTAGLIQSVGEEMPDQSYFYNQWGPGDVKYTDLDGNNIINDGDRTLDSHGDLTVIGNTSPRYTIGLSGRVAWKNFDFNMLLQGVLKRDLPSQSYFGSNVWWGIGTRGDGGGAFYQGHDDYWRPADETNLFGPNTDAYYPKPYVSSETYKNQLTQTRYQLNAKYIRLKNIQLGYTIPRSLTDKIKVQVLKIYVSGENLITFDKLPPYLDPETAFATDHLGAVYPLSKSFSVGLNITF